MAHPQRVAGLWKLSLAVFCFSALLHGLIIFQVLPGNRFVKYQVAATQYLNGTIEAERLLDFSPLYLVLHVAVGRVFQDPDTALLCLQLMLTAFSSTFLFQLLRWFFPPALALIGTAAFVTSHSIIVYTGTFEPEPLVVCFALGFLRWAMRPGEPDAGVSGAFLALGLLTRATFFPLIVIAPIYFKFRIPQRRRWLRAVVVFALPIIVALSFLTVRNAGITGTFTPFAMNPGTVFFEGNNPNSTGQSAIYPPLIQYCREDFPADSDFRHVLYRIFARRIAGSPLSVNAVNAYWSQKAKNYIVDHPGRFLRLLLIKTTFVFHDFKRHDIMTLFGKEERIAQVLPCFPFALISVLALAGMVLSAPVWKEKLLIYALVFSQIGVMVLTYVSERQRVAIISLMVFFAARALHTLISDKRAGMRVLPFILFFPFLYLPNDIAKDDRYLLDQSIRQGRLMQAAADHRSKGQLTAAATANAMAYAAAPWAHDTIRLAMLGYPQRSMPQQALEAALWFKSVEPSRLLDLAVLHMETGGLNAAWKVLTYLWENGYTFNRRFNQSSQPAYYLARICALRGETDLAIAYLKRAQDRCPGDPWVLAHLAAMTEDAIYENKLLRYFDDIDAAYFLGRACLDAGRTDAAVRHLSVVSTLLPEFRRGKIYLSLALGAAGRYREAAERYLQAIGQRIDPVFGESETIAIFRSWSESAPADDTIRYHLSVVLKLFGKYTEALRMQQALLKDDPHRTDLIDSIRWLEAATDHR